MENRSYVLDRLKSRKVSIDEFNFDKLQAPPIAVFFSPMDIAHLNHVAKSLKYSARLKEKYQEIDRIMRRRGFEKFISGTNRITYRCVEDNSFLVKVAFDAVGLSDSLREFRNQMFCKPFVQKVFEVTPCGTLAFVERVVPITSEEEFRSVASDIFEVINTWFIGEYVLEDIGTKFFMNWGIRKGFGPVLLDFPYIYKLDGNKLFCNAPNPLNPSGRCEGVIDYDDGFNFLHCTKCGALYRAKELEEAIKEKNILIKSEGGIKMKVAVKGGSKNLSTTVTTGQYADLKKSTPVAPVSANPKPINSGIKVSITRSESKNKEYIKETKVTPAVEETTEQQDAIITDGVTETKNPAKKSATDSNKNNAKKAVPESPVSFDDSEKGKGMSPVDSFKYALGQAMKSFEQASEKDQDSLYDIVRNSFKEYFDGEISRATEGMISIDEHNDAVQEAVAEATKDAETKKSQSKGASEKEIKAKIDKAVKEATKGLIKPEDAKKQQDKAVKEALKGMVSEEEVETRIQDAVNKAITTLSSNNAEDEAAPVPEELIIKGVKAATDQKIDIYEVAREIANDESTFEFCRGIIYHVLNSEIGDISLTAKFAGIEYDDEDGYFLLHVNLLILDHNDIENINSVSDEELAEVTLYNAGIMSFAMFPADMITQFEKAGYSVVASEGGAGNTVDTVESEGKSYKGCKFFAASIINLKTLFDDEVARKVMVINDNNGNYMTVNGGEVVAVDVVDEADLDSVSVVSKNWLDGIMKDRDEKGSPETTEDPTPTTKTVNGVKGE